VSDRADNRRFVAMLFGRNIFGSGHVRQTGLRSCLAALASALALGALVTPLVADAQQAEKTYRLGFLANVPPTTPEVARNWDGLMRGLREHGYVEGKNLQIERLVCGRTTGALARARE
jgi:hypothetical protein